MAAKRWFKLPYHSRLRPAAEIPPSAAAFASRLAFAAKISMVRRISRREEEDAASLLRRAQP